MTTKSVDKTKKEKKTASSKIYAARMDQMLTQEEEDIIKTIKKYSS